MIEMPVYVTGEQQLARFADMLRAVCHSDQAPARFTVARAPAFMDILGGFGEFAGSTVLAAGAGQAVLAGVQARNDRYLHIRLDGLDDTIWCEAMSLRLDSLAPPSGLVTFDQARAELLSDGRRPFAARCAGCVYALLASGWLEVDQLTGLSLCASADICTPPEETAVSAILIATLSALCGHFGLQMGEYEMARIGRIVEERIMGASAPQIACLSSALCTEQSLMVTCCRPHDILGQHPIPEGWRFVSIHSGARNPYITFRYAHVRTAVNMGLSILQHLSRDDWGGFLCSVCPDVWRPWRDRIPEVISGADYIQHYPERAKEITEITPNTEYRVRDCMEHVILENDRVREFVALMQMASGTVDEQLLQEAGQLMLDGHASYFDRLRLGSAETELLVELAKQRGPLQSIFGATICGNGYDSLVTLLCADDYADRAIIDICDEYHRRTGLTPRLMTGASQGASQFGVRTIDL